MWLGGEDQEAWLDYDGPSCKHEGKARGLGAMDHQGGEIRVESFAPMDRGNGEEQVKLEWMNQ